MKLNFQKNERALGNLRSFCKVNFVLPILFVLTLVFGKAVLYGNVAFSILLRKKRYSSFLKKYLVFRKTCFKVKVIKTFKIPQNYVKTCRSLLSRRLF